MGEEQPHPATGRPELDSLLAAHADDCALLAALARYIADGERGLAAARGLRLAAALRLRGSGVSVTAIATVARVTDSYLARELLRAGARRTYQRARRGKPPTRR